MPTSTVEQDHEVRLRRLEERIDRHMVWEKWEPSLKQTYCCIWLLDHREYFCSTGMLASAVFCPSCGRKLHA